MALFQFIWYKRQGRKALERTLQRWFLADYKHAKFVGKLGILISKCFTEATRNRGVLKEYDVRRVFRSLFH